MQCALYLCSKFLCLLPATITQIDEKCLDCLVLKDIASASLAFAFGALNQSAMKWAIIVFFLTAFLSSSSS